MAKQIKWWIFIVISSFLIIYLMPNSLLVSVNEKMNRYQVEEKARNFIIESGYSLDNYHSRVTRNSANYILAYLKMTLEQERYNTLVNSDSIPNIRWIIQYTKNIPQDHPQSRYTVWISPRGHILGFRRSIPDTLTIHSIAEDEAARKAQLFLTDNIELSLNNFILRTSQQFQQPNRKDYTFSWEKSASFGNGKLVIHVFIQGDQVAGYEYLYHLPETVQQRISSRVTQGTLLSLSLFIGLTIIFVYILILFLKKYHDGEVSVQLGRNLFMIIFFLGLLRSINEWPVIGSTLNIGNMSVFSVQIIAFVFEILIKNVFLGVLLLTAWAVGEAYARSHWPEKMNSIDSLLNKKFFTLNTGMALLRGGAIGFLTAMLFMFVITIFTGKDKNVLQIILPYDDSFQLFIPVVSITIVSIMMALICEVVFRFFVINAAYYRWQKKWIAILFSALLWPIGYFILTDYPLFSSYLLNIILALIMGLCFAWLYFKYDLLTLISATASANIIFYSLPLMASSAEWHRISLIVLIIILIIPALQIIISFVRRDYFQYTYAGLPEHIRRISERERMQKELEIARNVQMGLLPKSNPKVEGFDIGGICLPAKEVGGDYFDFVNLSMQKLGIAIGDVSGKGVPAAIYMTLTKGILQSHADETVSPRLVLNKVNKLLYRNIEKNSFVSMFYAVLDIKTKMITFARAGHNPGIMIDQQDGSNQSLNTDGIALGLEEGTIFNNMLKEQTLQLSSGDTLVFYTDGFTEAMNSFKQEFGEEKFIKIISENRHLSADELIDILIKSVAEFTKDTIQHDDMTVVVIKVH